MLTDMLKPWACAIATHPLGSRAIRMACPQVGDDEDLAINDNDDMKVKARKRAQAARRFAGNDDICVPMLTV